MEQNERANKEQQQFMKQANELIAGFRIQPLHLLSTRSSPVESLIMELPGRFLQSIQFPSFVFHQKLDQCLFPRETSFTSFPRKQRQLCYHFKSHSQTANESNIGNIEM